MLKKIKLAGKKTVKFTPNGFPPSVLDLVHKVYNESAK